MEFEGYKRETLLSSSQGWLEGLGTFMRAQVRVGFDRNVVGEAESGAVALEHASTNCS
jgi:hypothetical protein